MVRRFVHVGVAIMALLSWGMAFEARAAESAECLAPRNEEAGPEESDSRLEEARQESLEDPRWGEIPRVSPLRRDDPI